MFCDEDDDDVTDNMQKLLWNIGLICIEKYYLRVIKVWINYFTCISDSSLAYNEAKISHS